MMRGPRRDTVHRRRRARWLFLLGLFAGLALGPGSPDSAASVSERPCVSPAFAVVAVDGARPSTPTPHPCRHAPCGAVIHRGSAPQRTAGAAQPSALPRRPVTYTAPATEPGRAHPSRRPAALPAADLLTGICVRRT